MENYQSALERYREVAEAGDMTAQRRLAKVLLTEGLRYLESSVLAQDGEAMDILSSLQAKVNRLLYKGKSGQRAVRLLTMEDAGDIQPGSEVLFGKNPADGMPIIWQVLDRQGERVLLLSRYILSYRTFHDKWGYVTWDNSEIRTFLNGSFLDMAFNSNEKYMLVTSKVEAHENSMCNVDPGHDTRDRVFLLSVQEAEKYFTLTSDRKCFGATENKKGISAKAHWWWLRSPGFNETNAASVREDGVISYNYVQDIHGGVRPAMWVDVGS